MTEFLRKNIFFSELGNQNWTNNIPDKNLHIRFILELCKIQGKIFERLSPADGALLRQLLTKTDQNGLISNIIYRVLNSLSADILGFLTQDIKNNKKFCFMRKFDEISQEIR